jgi:pimeloyl-ACP methyl ester carboxylesterase
MGGDLDGRIRAAEQALYAHYGLTPRERRIGLDQPDVNVRLVEFKPDDPISDAVPVVLLHGIASITAAAAPLVQYLTVGRPIIAVDWPGHGLSGPVTLRRGESIRTHAVGVLRALFAALGLDRADVVGHSMGAQFTLYLALDAPELVRRAVLIGAPGAGLPGVRPVPAMRLLSVPGVGHAVLKAPLSRTAYRRNNDAMLGKGVVDRYPPEMIDVGYLAGQRPGFAASVSSFFRSLITPIKVRDGVAVTTTELSTMTVPVLLVWGTDDVFMPPTSAASSIDAIPQHTLVTISGAGHMPWLDDPKRCGTAVTEFLDSPKD